MKTIITVLFTLILFPVYSQNNPGYMGKHIVLSGEGTFTKSFLLEKTWLKYGGSAEIIFSKKYTIGFSYHYNNDILAHSKFVKSNFEENIRKKIESINCTYYYAIPIESIPLISHQFSIDFYKYKTGSIAPLGNILVFSFFYIRNSSPVTLDKTILTDYHSNNYSSFHILSAPPPLHIQKMTLHSNNFGLQVLIAKRRIIKNFLIITYGIKMGSVLINPIFGYQIYDIFNKPEHYHFEQLVRLDNTFSTIMALHLGFGFVL